MFYFLCENKQISLTGRALKEVVETVKLQNGTPLSEDGKSFLMGLLADNPEKRAEFFSKSHKHPWWPIGEAPRVQESIDSKPKLMRPILSEPKQEDPQKPKPIKPYDSKPKRQSPKPLHPPITTCCVVM